MGVTNYGTGSDKLSAPQLSAWAGSVASALDSSDVTVNTRLAAYAPLASPALTGNPTAPTPAAGDNDTSIATTAFVRANTVRVTRPNTDDRLVEAWNGSAWSVVGYDSGWRDVSANLINSWVLWVSAPFMRIRRVNQTIFLLANLNGTSATANKLMEPITGWTLAGTSMRAVFATDNGSGTVSIAQVAADSSFQCYARGLAFINMAYPTDSAIPTSLPGTLISAAPA